jgi:hypothetical protein
MEREILEHTAALKARTRHYPTYPDLVADSNLRPTDYENTAGSCTVLKGHYYIRFFNDLQPRLPCQLYSI